MTNLRRPRLRDPRPASKGLAFLGGTFLALLAAACSEEGPGGTPPSRPPATSKPPASAPPQSTPPAATSATVPAEIFGAHTVWNDLGNYIIDNGEQVRDRSFRMASRFWRPVNQGKAEARIVEAGGAPNASGAPTYPGHAVLTVRASESIASLYHQVQDGVAPGDYVVEFSSRGADGAPAVMVALVDSNYGELAPSVIDASEAGTWKRHRLSLAVTKQTLDANLAVCVISKGAAQIDEVRMYRADGPPTVRPSAKARIRELGIRSLRWPGGSDVDTLDWRQTIGPLARRGEQSVIYGGLQTPSYGLHEFLDLCDELELAPVIAVNVLDKPESAGDLIEYVLGGPDTPQGKIRAQHGRRSPWSTATRFELGNEPTTKYAEEGRLAVGGGHYGECASAVARAMHDRARRIGADIETAWVSEGAMQMADWLGDRGESVVTLLHTWNELALADATPGELAQATNAHYYAYHGFSKDPRQQFENLMAAGAVLSATLDHRIRPHAGKLPVWLTEYHVLLSDEDVVQPAFTLDFQSGLVVADILMTAIQEGIPVAHIHNLSEQGVFGLLRRTGDRWQLRPAALTFQLLSAAAGEERLEVQLSGAGVTDEQVIRSGNGNIPSGTRYRLVQALATRNEKTGSPRLFLMNRSFDRPMTVEVTIPGFTLGGGVAHWYRHDDLRANNEKATAVRVTTEQVPGGQPWKIELPPHSFVRVDLD